VIEDISIIRFTNVKSRHKVRPSKQPLHPGHDDAGAGREPDLQESAMIVTATAPVRSFGPASVLRRLAPLVLPRVKALLRAIAHRRAVHQLLDLDARGLRDIGLVRSDVTGALDRPWVMDPSAILVVRSVTRRGHDWMLMRDARQDGARAQADADR
jgi:uncharacterized protein YjiS (DUF1127 family)